MFTILLVLALFFGVGSVVRAVGGIIRAIGIGFLLILGGAFLYGVFT